MPVTTLDDRLASLLADNFADFDPSSDIDDLWFEHVPGYDSLAMVDFMFAVEDEFGIAFTDVEFMETTSVQELKTVLAGKGVQ